MANNTTKSKATNKAVAETDVAEKEKNIVAKEIDPNQYVTVRNGFHGKLVYHSSRTGERFVWDGFGSEQEMELRELRNARNNSKSFFANNWFMFDEEWIVDYLGVRQFYKNAVRIEDFDNIFKQTPAELKKTIKTMTAGQKRSLIYRATELISSGEIDSRKTVAAIEDALGVKLSEE